MRRMLNVATTVLLLGAVSVLAPTHVGAQEDNPQETKATQQWTRTAENSAPTMPSGEADSYQTEDADGASWAPGGFGAANYIVVRGTGLHVDTGAVAYNVGGNLLANTCADEFEIAYYERGERKTETAAGHCAPFRVTHRFDINRPLDPQSPFCGRAKVGGVWGNYACITIHN